MAGDRAPVDRYFRAIEAAFDGLDTYLDEEDSPLYQHGVVGAVVAEYLQRLRGSFNSWQHRLSFADKFRVSQTESGFPAYQNVLDLENDRRDAKFRLAELPLGDEIIDDSALVPSAAVGVIAVAEQFGVVGPFDVYRNHFDASPF